MKIDFLFTLFALIAITEGAAVSKKYKKWKKYQKERRMENEVYNDDFESVSSASVKPTWELIKLQGYPVQVHKVETEDGYILELHRIPYGRTRPNRPKNRPPILLQHCLMCSSSDWIMNSPNKALANMLADAGYDVWLGNARGNTYSTNHATLDTNDAKYWNFSWHEMGKYDLPAMIDYILKTTNNEKLYYVGFSMGTTMFFTLMHERPEYKDKIQFSVLLAPVGPINNIGGPLSYRYIRFILNRFLYIFGQKQVFQGGKYLDYLSSSICNPDSIISSMCHQILFYLTGSNDEQLNKDYLPVMLSHTPAGTSGKTLLHFLQVVDSGEFKQFDGGYLYNYNNYGSMIPPEYDLKKIDAPVAIFYSDNDVLAAPKDVEHLIKELPNVVYSEKLQNQHFTHLDFIWALDADKYLYRNVIKILKKN